MQNETSLQELNTQSQTVNNAIITLGDTDDSGKGRHFKSRFIQPGVAGYPGQFGNVLITKQTLDKFIQSMVGVPVIIQHKNITAKNADEERVGVVNSVWYDENDGWYWCDGIIWDDTAINLIQDQGWSVSCSYDVKLADNAGGSENNIKYDMEFLDGVFTHLALVNNPRYERATIVFNSKTFNVENFSKEQPRVPKGQPNGGQFASQDERWQQMMDSIERYKQEAPSKDNDPFSATGHSKLLSDIASRVGYSQVEFNRNKLKDNDEYYAYRAELNPTLQEAYEKVLKKAIESKGRKSRWFNNGIDVVVPKNIKNSKEDWMDEMILDSLKSLIAAVENEKDDSKDGRWITIKGTHIFIPEGKSVEEVAKKKGIDLSSTQKEGKTKGYYGDEEGVTGLISKQRDKEELEKIIEIRKHLEEQSNKIKKELKGKYEREDVEFDEEQLKKDIREAQSFGYEEVEDIAEFLGLDEDEVRETLARIENSRADNSLSFKEQFIDTFYQALAEVLLEKTEKEL